MKPEVESVAFSQSVKLPEMRVYQYQVPEKPSLEEIKQQISLVADAGFNGIQIPFFQEGYPLFYSKVAEEHHLPAIRPDLKKRRDFFYELFQIAGEYNLPLYAYTEPLRIGDVQNGLYNPLFRKRKKWVAMNKSRDFYPIDISGEDLFLCINNVDVRRFVADLMIEVAESFPFYAFVLDLHRYPNFFKPPERVACFCDYCRKHVKQELQLDLLTLSPEKKNPATRRWKRWKKQRLFSFVSYISGRLRKTRMGMPFFTIVKGGLESRASQKKVDRTGAESNSQDQVYPPGAWACEGLITSLVTYYSPESPTHFSKMLKHDLSRISDESLLAATLHAKSAEQLADYILHLRKLPVWGFFISLSSPLQAADAASLSKVPFSSPSMDYLSNLLISTRILIEHIFHASKLHPAMNSFLREVMNYLDAKENHSPERTQSLVDDFRTIEQKYQSGDLDMALLPQETVRHISLIKKLLRASILLGR